jgi:CzcA family heavy metal efflux pump
VLRWIVEASLRRRFVVLAAALALILVGVPALLGVPVDVFPEFAPPLVEIQTEAPGLSAEEVESLVTIPIENAVNGVAWLTTLRSKSVPGLSSVVLFFEEGTDRLRGRQLVQERLASVASGLPLGVHVPLMMPPLSATSRLLKIGITSETRSLEDLSRLARWTIRPRLLAVRGVAGVAVWGQRDRELQVRVDPDRLQAHGVSLDELVRTAGDAVPVAAGGFFDTPNQRISVNHGSGVRSADALALATVAFRGSAPLPLGAVAEVSEGSPPPIGDGIVNDRLGLLLVVEKQPWGNTLEVTRGVEQALEALRPALPGVSVDAAIFRPASFIERSLQNLRRALLFGALLVVVVLVALLQEWRTALISALAIPLSLIAATLVYARSGAAIDTMVLAGLAIALGAVVDDAIVDIENIMRRLRLNARSEAPQSAFAVVLRASLEVRSAVLVATLVIVLALLPVLFLPGLAGAFFRPLALAYVLAVLASLVVALSVTPALALWLLPAVAERRDEAPLARWLRERYRAALPAVLSRREQAAPFLGAVLGLTALAAMWLGQEFMPRFQEHDFLMHWVGKPGTSIEAMDRVTLRVSRELRALPGVQSFGAHIGRAVAADEVVGANFGELWIHVDPEADHEAALVRVQEVIDGYPGIQRDLLTYLRERVKEVLSGAGASLVVRIYGPELEGLRAHARSVAEAMRRVEGVADLQIESQVSVPQVELMTRPEAMAVFGITPADTLRTLHTLLQGRLVGQIHEEQETADVVVRGVEALRSDPSALGRVPVAMPGGGWVPLDALADVRIVPRPNVIQREGASRRIDVTCNVAGRDLGAVGREIESRLRGIAFESGYHAELLGEHLALREARHRLLAAGCFCLAAIFVLIQMDLRSTRFALLVFASLPFALVGGVIGAWLGGGVLSLGSLVGFVAVLGVAARNGILLVSHIRHLMREEDVPFGTELVQRGAEERFTPIVMTALATALALVPIALGGNRPGQEIEHPMALVILGGLVTSTALNLLVMPALILRFGAAGAFRGPEE